MTDAGAFSLLSQDLKGFLDDAGWQPTPVQQAAIPDLIAGKHRLLVAPTGSGKTEAAALPLISQAQTEQWEPMSILWITPLRALNRDIDRRLESVAAAAGLNVGLRHGDTPQNERNKQSRNPPHLLVTTPETTQILLIGKRLRQHLSNLRAVVIDEVHDLAASERGSQLLIALERIDELAGRRVQRVGLSATVGNPKEVASWLSPTCEAINAPTPRATEVRVTCWKPTEIDEAQAIEMSTSPRAMAALRGLANRLRDDAPALVFVNSRNAAETVAQRLTNLDSGLEIGIHHGSLSTAIREEMEQRLQAGELHALVCTSSLELGIDVGSVNQVHQIQSPRAVDRLLQRVGRAEHHLGGTGRGALLAWEPDEIAESSVIARRAMAGELDGVGWRLNPRTVAVNQLVLMTLAEGIIPLAAPTALLQRTSIFPDWTDEDTLEILRILDDRWLIKLVEDPASHDPLQWAPKLWKTLAEAANSASRTSPKSTPTSTTAPSAEMVVPEDRPTLEEIKTINDRTLDAYRDAIRAQVPAHLADGWYSAAGRTRDYMLTNLSMIPDKQRYTVRDAVTRSTIGTVDEVFVLSLDDSGSEEDGSPRRFVMMGRTWEMVDADPERSEVLVAPVSEAGHAPVWSGELPPVPAAIAREVGSMRRAVSNLLAGEENGDEQDDGREENQLDGEPAGGLTSWIAGCDLDYDIDDYPIGTDSLQLLGDAIADHVAAADSLPDGRLLAIEKRQDAIIIHSCHGSKINETLGHFLQAMASTLQGKMGRLLIDPYRITLQVPGLEPANVVAWLTETPPEGLPDLMRVTIPNGRQLRARLVHVCKVFGILRRGVDPRRVNLNGIANRYRNTPVMEEALDKLFAERMDMGGTIDLLKAIQSGLVEVRITAPGPLGLSPRSERDMLLPNWSNNEVRKRLESRLLNERAIAICLRCHSPSRFRVARYPELAQRCSCGSSMRAVLREGRSNELKEAVKSDEVRTQNRMIRNAELVQNRGFDAILCLMARGVGEDTAIRILRTIRPGDHETMFKAIHEAEIQYARTRRFWN